MSRPRYLSIFSTALLACAVATGYSVRAQAAPQTVCTITVNSSDEKEAFQRHLPADRFKFVELVERGRTDWLESARRKGIRCDVLIISGHYDGGDYAGGNEFFSEYVDRHEYLPVDEMERVACSAPEDGLFSQLKAVYLFGCNTLNPEPLRSSVDELRRSLVQSGHAQSDADRLARALSARYADSSRDRMRHIFRNVPAIYGFSSVAPLGPVAASNLDRYFKGSGARSVGSGQADATLLAYFPGRSLTVTRGVRDSDADAALRQDVCRFVDDRLSPVRKVEAVHELLRRDMAEVRVFLDRLERFSVALGDAPRRSPEVVAALEAITRDENARMRFLAFMRASDRPSVRARMIDVAADFNWLSATERREELARMIADQLAREAVTAADVDLVCKLNADRSLDGVLAALPSNADAVGPAAVRACLGSEADEARVVQALVAPRDTEVQIAQVYLRHRPIENVHEVRELAAGIAKMTDPVAQARALDTLAHLRVSDRATLDVLTDLFPVVKSVGVQRAIAGILIRSDLREIASPGLVRALREHRLKSPEGRDLIDVLIQRLQIVS